MLASSTESTLVRMFSMCLLFFTYLKAVPGRWALTAFSFFFLQWQVSRDGPHTPNQKPSQTPTTNKHINNPKKTTPPQSKNPQPTKPTHNPTKTNHNKKTKPKKTTTNIKKKKSHKLPKKKTRGDGTSCPRFWRWPRPHVPQVGALVAGVSEPTRPRYPPAPQPAAACVHSRAPLGGGGGPPGTLAFEFPNPGPPGLRWDRGFTPGWGGLAATGGLSL